MNEKKQLHLEPVQGGHYIGGRWIPTDSTFFTSRNPADQSDIIGTFPVGDSARVDQAVTAAQQGFSTWRRLSRIERADYFDRLARIIQRDTNDLSLLMARECGKNITECRAEVIEGLHMVQYVFGTARMPTGQIVASEIPDKDALILRKPWGVVAVITPWNFPFAVPLWMLGPSLLEGNTAIFKPSEETPAIGQRLIEMFIEAGFPDGVIHLIHGEGPTGEALVRHPSIQVVLFTGSYDVGRQIQKVSADIHDRIVAAEMGSKSAVIICEDARLDLAVAAGIISAFKTSGQRCVSASRLLVARPILHKYISELVGRAQQIRIGNPLDSSNFMGPLINQAAVDKVLSLLGNKVQ